VSRRRREQLAEINAAVWIAGWIVATLEVYVILGALVVRAVG
jgi:hypothetical protein